MSTTALYNIKLFPGVKKIKVTTLSYLYEIASIPEKVRLEYMQKLLKRKNASSQKNVQLLNIIFYHIKEDKMLEWDEVSICRVLNISKDMLFCHKSRILKSLRLLYFNWKNIESQEIEILKNKISDKFMLRFLRGAEMAKIGMWREAKNEFLILYRDINTKRYKTISDKVLIAKICKALITYYYNKQNKLKFNLYYNKSRMLCEHLIKNKTLKKSRKLFLQVALLRNYLTIQESFFKLKSSSNHDKISNTFDKICSLQKQYKDNGKHVTALLDTGVLYATQKNYKEAFKRFTEGMKLAKKNNFHLEWRILKMYSLVTKVRAGQLTTEFVVPEILNLYEELNKYTLRSYLKERALSTCCEIMSIQEDKNLFFKFLYEYTSSYILRYGYNGSLAKLYCMKFEYYQKKIKKFKLEKYGEKKIPVLFDIDPVYRQKLMNTSNEVLQNFHNMRESRMKNIHFKWSALMGILETEFWKGTEMNYEYSNHIAGTMDRLKKSWSDNILRSDNVRFPSLKLCIDIIEDSKHLSKAKLLNKYEYKFRELSKLIIEVKDERIVDLYSIFSYTAQITGYKEFKTIIGNVYLTLNNKYPNKFKHILDELKQKKNELKNTKKFNVMEFEVPKDKAA